MFKKFFKKYRFYLSIFVLSFILAAAGLILNEKEANKGAESAPKNLLGEKSASQSYFERPLYLPLGPENAVYNEGMVLSAEESTTTEADLYDEEEDGGTPSFIFPVSSKVLREYSDDKLIYFKDMGDWRTHQAVDYAASPGEIVLAAADGIVENVYKDPLYGTCVVISHSGGFKSIYSSLLENQTVNIGEELLSGDAVGIIAESSLAEADIGTHLHFALICDGVYVNPSEYLR